MDRKKLELVPYQGAYLLRMPIEGKIPYDGMTARDFGELASAMMHFVRIGKKNHTCYEFSFTDEVRGALGETKISDLQEIIFMHNDLTKACELGFGGEEELSDDDLEP